MLLINEFCTYISASFTHHSISTETLDPKGLQLQNIKKKDNTMKKINLYNIETHESHVEEREQRSKREELKERKGRERQEYEEQRLIQE